MAFSERFDRALVHAHDLHRNQRRKGGGAPYVSHLLGVASIVIEHGGTEDQAIAALLHDAGEDAGGDPTVVEIGRRYGPVVESIVRACSDTLDAKKPAWRARKERYVAHLADAPAEALLVSLADKVYNARSIVMDLREEGPSAFDKFTGNLDGTLWYYRALVAALEPRIPGPLVEELRRQVDAMHELAGA